MEEHSLRKMPVRFWLILLIKFKSFTMNIIILSFAIYAIYNIVSIYKNKGIPNSLSTTYYIWPKWVFPLVSLAISWTLMPGLVGLTHGSLFFFLPFLVFIGLTFIGIFPNYKKDATHYKVHSSLAYAMALYIQTL